MISRNSTSLKGRSSRGLSYAFAAAAAGLLITFAASAQTISTLSACAIEASNGLHVEDTVLAAEGGFGEFPIDLMENIWERPPSVDDPNLSWGAWCFANEDGRVRGRVITGTDDDSPIETELYLIWQKSFIRTAGAPHPDFTVNPSHLLIEAYLPPLTEEEAAQVFAEMSFEVTVHTSHSDFTVFEHYSWMFGQPGRDNFHFEQETEGFGAYVLLDGEYVHPANEGAELDEREALARFDLPRHNQVINLDHLGVDIGDQYRIVYVLKAAAGEHPTAESRAEAFIGDPLDAGTGFELSSSDEPAEESLTSCEAVSDPNRYDDHQDATVTDTRTGLMWQRCPVAFDLDDAGTPADPTDDNCISNGDTQLQWQAALQAAVASTLGGYDDWRTPNLKELETLIAACSPALIDPLAFPGMPGSPFWSATPEADDNAAPRRAWQLDFGDGELWPVSRVANAHLLLVRDGGDTPSSPGVAMTAGNTSAAEGDAGVSTLTFPVALSQPMGVDASVDYVVSGLSATDSDDFTAAAGSLTIPAGETHGHIDVELIGDTEVEFNELLELELTSPGAGVRLRKAYGIGTIIDDEPVFRLARTVDASEADANQSVDIVVQLDRPAAAPITIDYATRDDTATVGNDYLAASGTVLIQQGESEGTIALTIVGDMAPEGVETFEIEFDNAIGAVLLAAPVVLAVNIVDNDGPGTYAALNDTGVTDCASGDQAVLACPQAGYPGQDAETGRDVTHADPSDGALGFSFVKRDAAGDALASQAALYSESPWDCVEDQVTSLYWEVKNDQAGDLRYFDDTFTWYNSSGSNDGGDAGTPNGGLCADAANCDTEKYVAAVNSAGLCGFNDWRLPSADELFTIAWLSAESGRGVDTGYFPNHFTPGDGRGYWSASPSAVAPSNALRVRLDAGVSFSATLSSNAKSTTQRIRLVRGGTRLPQQP